MKFLHTGDVHLDSPFAGLDPQTSEMRRSEARATFSRMMEFARSENVDMVLIAGDLFDDRFITRETVSLLVREFSGLDCPVVIAPGNHDPASDRSIWNRNIFPDNVYVFTSPELTYFRFEEPLCDVYGYAFTAKYMTSCPLDGMRPEDSGEESGRINLLCAHGDTTSPLSRVCPIPQSVLRAFGPDFAALGHIHNPESANSAMTVPGGYCGCPEGRDFGEYGVKGAYLVTVEKNGAQAKSDKRFIPFSKRVYRRVGINVDGAAAQSEAGEALRRVIESEGWGEETLLRAVFSGSVETSFSMDISVMKDYAAGLYALEIEDETSPTWNSDYLEKDKGICGEVYRTLLPGLESEDRRQRLVASRALRYALAALGGNDMSSGGANR